MSFVRQCLTTVALGVAIWLSLGTLAVTGPHTSFRIGLLPPLWILGLALLVSGILCFWRRTPHRWFLVWPAALLWLPWLPLPVPASFVIWIGPVVTLVWAAIAIAWLSDLRVPWPAIASGVVSHPVRAPVLAAIVAFATFTCAAWHLAPWLPEGDEPHYLVITQSLLYDGDLQIENNHRAGQYAEYIARDLRPDYLRRGVNGQIYSIHAPGLPALVLPAFALGGYRGVTIFLSLIAALGTALAWHVGWLLTQRASAAWIGWGAITGSTPFFFHTFTVFPDGVAATIVLTGIYALVRASRLTPTRAMLHGAALALLPWLHTRYVILALTIGLLVIARLVRGGPDQMRRLAAFLVIPLGSAVAWFAFFFMIYGTPNPAAPYGSATQGSLRLLPDGVVGLLFDQQFGLIANAPIYLVSLTGIIWTMVRPAQLVEGRAQRRLAIEMLIIAVPYALAAAAYPMWWGGWSAPARFWVPLTLMSSIPVALVWAHARTHTTRACVGVALGVTIWLTIFFLSVDHGRIVYNDRDGYALWTDWAGSVADLAEGLPSLFRYTWVEALQQAAIWCGAVMGIWLVLRRVEGASWSAAPVRTPLFMTAVVPAAMGIAGMISFSGVWHVVGDNGLRPNLSQLGILHHLRPGTMSRAITYGPHGWPTLVPAQSVPERLLLGNIARRTGRDHPLLFLPYVPAGRYQLIASSAYPMEGELQLVIGRSPRPIASCDLADSQSHACEIALAVSAESFVVRGDERAARTVSRVQLKPLAVVPLLPHAEDGPYGPFALQAMKYGPREVFAITDRVYMEPAGFWVPPAMDTALVVVSSARENALAPLRLTLRNGPAENHVSLEIARWHRELTIAANEETLIDAPVAIGGRTLLQMHVERGFRPSALDPKNPDGRLLGVWVALR